MAPSIAKALQMSIYQLDITSIIELAYNSGFVYDQTPEAGERIEN